VDYLRGLKENVIMGRLIPAGTGMDYYRNVKLQSDVPEELETEAEGEVEQERPTFVEEAVRDHVTT